MEEAPFPDLKIVATDFLDSLSGRSKCPQCRKSRKYYCYSCYVPIAELADKVPKLKLPIKVDIIKHPSECDGKSTAVHAGVICPEDVTIFTYPCIPEYCKEKTVLVFPGNNSITLEQLAEQCHLAECRVGNTKENTANTTHIENYTREDRDTNIDSDTLTTDQNDIDSNFKVEAKEPAVSNDNSKCVMQASGKLFEESQSKSAKLDGGTERGKHKDIAEDGKVENKELMYNGNNECCIQRSGQLLEDSQTHSIAKQENQDEVKDNNQTVDSENDYRNGTETGGGNYVAPFDRVVFVDSTWNQTRSICNDERLKGLTCIELKTRTTKFWRHQDDVPDTYLSTVEAIYYFLRDYHEHFIPTVYKGEYDNLLFFFTFMYRKIRTIYDGGEELRAYKKRKVTHN